MVAHPPVGEDILRLKLAFCRRLGEELPWHDGFSQTHRRPISEPFFKRFVWIMAKTLDLANQAVTPGAGRMVLITGGCCQTNQGRKLPANLQNQFRRWRLQHRVWAECPTKILELWVIAAGPLQ